MNHVDAQYKAIVDNIRENGVDKLDRTGVGSRSVFGERAVYDLTDGRIPLLTTKKVFTRLLTHELLWFVGGDDDIEYLLANDVSIWNSWVDESTARYNDQGELIGGRVPEAYPKQWRHWNDTRVVSREEGERLLSEFDGYAIVSDNLHIFNESDNTYIRDDSRMVIRREIDQPQQVIDTLRNNPDSRRILLTAWNPAVIDQSGLPPCHVSIQFWTRELSHQERLKEYGKCIDWKGGVISQETPHETMDNVGAPRRALSARLWQR